MTSFKTFNMASKPIIDNHLPILIRGRHGIGKSELVYQIAAERGLEVVERRASQMTEGDLLGLPDKDVMSTENGNRSITVWDAPEWFAIACERPVVLFLDEVDRATLEVRQGIFELTDSRKINGWKLHKDTLIFAAVNGGEGVSNYQVADMDPAELDRWSVFDVDPTVEDWLDWANGRIDPVIVNFINENRSHLEHTGIFEPGKVYPSRRSWARLNSCLQGQISDQSNLALMTEIAKAIVGAEAAYAFQGFVAKYNFRVTYQDIFLKGELSKTDNFTINDYTALLEEARMDNFFEKDWNEFDQEVILNICDYMVKMPAEVGMMLIENISSSKFTENAIVIHGVTTRNGTLIQDHILSLIPMPS